MTAEPARPLTVALAGDTMLGRGVASALAEGHEVVAAEVAAVAGEADLFVLNLECCISERGERWPDPRKPFFFRAPPVAAERLAELGVDCVTLANNHALDYGEQALLDTFEHLARAGVAWVGAGRDEREARAPRVLAAGGRALTVVAASDHPAGYAAGRDRAGIAYVELRRRLPRWLRDAVAHADAGAAVLVTPHWGPNMTAGPVPRVVAAARALVGAGATIVAGHSAHVFHGVAGRVLYDLGDFVDDYRTDPRLRNDLGLLWLATLEARRVRRLEAIPLKLDYCRTRLADTQDAEWIARRLEAACASLGTEVRREDGRLLIAAQDGV